MLNNLSAYSFPEGERYFNLWIYPQVIKRKNNSPTGIYIATCGTTT